MSGGWRDSTVVEAFKGSLHQCTNSYWPRTPAHALGFSALMAASIDDLLAQTGSVLGDLTGSTTNDDDAQIHLDSCLNYGWKAFYALRNRSKSSSLSICVLATCKAGAGTGLGTCWEISTYAQAWPMCHPTLRRTVVRPSTAPLAAPASCCWHLLLTVQHCVHVSMVHTVCFAHLLQQLQGAGLKATECCAAAHQILLAVMDHH